MSYKITVECINCGACEPECPNQAIFAGDELFEINPDRCTECIPVYDEPQCAAVCPVDACVPDPEHPESRDELELKARHIK
jgi:ferredoxin